MKIKSFLCVTAMLATASSASAVISYNISGANYSQNFDSLTNVVGNTNAWANDTTLPGWFSVNSLPGSVGATGSRDVGTWNAVTNYRAGTGSANAGALWDFGVAGVNPDTERALGSIGSGTPGDFVIALVLQNTTGQTLTSFSLNYDGEQWRDGGSATPAAQTMVFDYSIFAAAPGTGDLEGDNVATYLAAPALDFTSPIFVAPAAGAVLDGNAAANRIANINSTIGLNWLNGEYLVLRWWDDNHPGNDHGLSLDNVGFSATPEPATMGLLAIGALAMIRRRR